jgi:hypothetical protein
MCAHAHTHTHTHTITLSLSLHLQGLSMQSTFLSVGFCNKENLGSWQDITYFYIYNSQTIENVF